LDKLGNQVRPIIQTSFPNTDAVFQDDNAPLHTTESAQSWFEEHEGELQHLPWPAQLLDLIIIIPLWSVLESRVGNRYPPPTSLKQLEHVLQEQWYKFPLDTVQNIYESIARRITVVLKENVTQHHIDKEMRTVSVVFPVFCPPLHIVPGFTFVVPVIH
jgi:hypothetical protein